MVRILSTNVVKKKITHRKFSGLNISQLVPILKGGTVFKARNLYYVYTSHTYIILKSVQLVKISKKKISTDGGRVLIFRKRGVAPSIER